MNKKTVKEQILDIIKENSINKTEHEFSLKDIEDLKEKGYSDEEITEITGIDVDEIGLIFKEFSNINLNLSNDLLLKSTDFSLIKSDINNCKLLSECDIEKQQTIDTLYEIAQMYLRKIYLKEDNFDENIIRLLMLSYILDRRNK